MSPEPMNATLSVCVETDEGWQLRQRRRVEPRELEKSWFSKVLAPVS